MCKHFLHGKAVPLSSLLSIFSGNLCHVTEEQLTTEARPGIRLTLNGTLEAFLFLWRLKLFFIGMTCICALNFLKFKHILSFNTAGTKCHLSCKQGLPGVFEGGSRLGFSAFPLHT